MIRTIIALIIIMSQSTILHAQGKIIIKDLDYDIIQDSVYFDKEKSILVCRLSSQNFAKIKSQPIDESLDMLSLEETKNGFKFNIYYMRSGCSNQFRFNKLTKKIQLIGMSRYSFGNASNDGEGESSVNLLTSDYIGDWKYLDMKKNKLIKIPTIKTKMKLGIINLESFSNNTYLNYDKKDEDIRDQFIRF